MATLCSLSSLTDSSHSCNAQHAVYRSLGWLGAFYVSEPESFVVFDLTQLHCGASITLLESPLLSCHLSLRGASTASIRICRYRSTHTFRGDLRLCQGNKHAGNGDDRAVVGTLLRFLRLPVDLRPIVGCFQEHDRTITRK